jgi:hypothetical protein
MMTVLGARFLGARPGFEAREHRDTGFCVPEGDDKVSADMYLVVPSFRVVGRRLSVLEMHGVGPYETDRRPLYASGKHTTLIRRL